MVRSKRLDDTAEYDFTIISEAEVIVPGIASEKANEAKALMILTTLVALAVFMSVGLIVVAFIG